MVSAAGSGGAEDRAGRAFEARGVERIGLFSDAVMAIAITLLAIELPVPSGDTTSTLWTSVRHEDGHYAAFLISFAVIAAAWIEHYDLYRCIERVDTRLLMLNSAWLLTIVLNPFATRLLTARGHPTTDAHALRFGFYALLQVLEASLMLAMVARMRSRRQAPDTPPRMLTKIIWESYAFEIGFGLSIPLFFATTYAWALWIVALLAIWGARRYQHR